MGVPLLLFGKLQKKRSAPLTYSDRILSLNPIAYWPLNDTSGIVARNSVSTALNGAYTGVDLAQAQAPFTCPFWDGLNDYCNIYSAGLNTINPKTAGSLSLWSKVYNSGVWTDATTRVIFVTNTASAQEVIRVHKSTTNGSIFLINTQGGTQKSVNSTSNTGTGWIHWVITWDKAADAMMGYKNAVQVGVTQTGLGVASANNLTSTICCIGSVSPTPTQVWHGYVAHAALWNRALTPTEIGNLYTWGL